MKKLFILITFISILYAQDRIFLKLSKSKAFLNEPIVAKVTVVYSKKAKYVTVNGFKNKALYSKFISESNQTIKNGEYYKKFTYILFPQATGTIDIAPRIAKVSRIQEKTGFTISDTLQSKPAKIEVYSLPNNLTISGNLNMHLKRLSKDAKANNPINFRLEITGSANLDDIKSFNLPIKDASYFSDKPTRDYKIVKSKLQAKFVQNFRVVSDKSYKIPPLKMTYFNTQTKLEESLLTKEQIVDIPKPLASKRELIFLLIGLITGIGISLLWLLKKRKKKLNNLQQAIKKAKNDKELYQILLPYSYKTELKEFIKRLEANIYNEAKNKINKKDIFNKI